jgi:hypothetical protein
MVLETDLALERSKIDWFGFFHRRMTVISGIEAEKRLRRTAVDRLIEASLKHMAPAREVDLESWRNLSGSGARKFWERKNSGLLSGEQETYRRF